jgi:protein-S-isoprenylcysteine O-methyltransferase Ste14
MSDELTLFLRLLVIVGLIAGAYEGLRRASAGAEFPRAGMALPALLVVAYLVIGLCLVVAYAEFLAPNSPILFCALMAAYLIAGFVLAARAFRRMKPAEPPIRS